jgi:hypothetical protein
VSGVLRLLIDRVFGELIEAKPEVAKEFIRTTLRKIATRIPEKQAHKAFTEFCNPARTELWKSAANVTLGVNRGSLSRLSAASVNLGVNQSKNESLAGVVKWPPRPINKRGSG